MPPMPPMNDEAVDADKLMKALEPVTSLVKTSKKAGATYGLFTDVLDAVSFVFSYPVSMKFKQSMFFFKDFDSNVCHTNL